MSELLVVPLGATEQHGPHLPPTTDTIIAAALCEGLPGAFVAPVLPYGSSGEHAGFPGTLSIGHVVRDVLVELVRGCSFARVVFVCAHGGNAEPLAAAVSQLRAEGRAVWAWSPSWGGDAHAGRTETSLMLALAPALVGPSRPVGNTEPLASLLPRLRASGVRALSENGVLGDASGASASEGEALLAAARADLRTFIGGLSTHPRHTEP